ncbi:MAG: hypothetical protein CM1200mP10_15150 [Candidatus Neomarinimicrobiota bacterium]|nr:MAG: hypothetical protein CM1200mP10_15150 [Candidatus Neomarinimicrobiota bacterium]
MGYKKIKSDNFKTMDFQLFITQLKIENTNDPPGEESHQKME